MKVITPASTLESWNKNITCGSCNAVLEVVATDIKYRRSSEMPVFDKFFVVCPECQNNIELSTTFYSLLTDHMKDRIRILRTLQKRTNGE